MGWRDNRANSMTEVLTAWPTKGIAVGRVCEAKVVIEAPETPP